MNRVVETYAPAIEGQTGASLGITEFGISTVQDFVGTYTTATDASGRRARSITNALGQLVRIDEPTGNNELGSLDAPNQPTYYKYNPQGKMVHVIQGKAGELAIQHRYFLYDYLGRLIRVRQPEQEVNSALDLTDTVTTNNQWTAGFEYDLVGNLKKTTDAKGSIITNSYDKAGRVTLRNYSNEPQGVTTPNVEYFYDGKGLTTPQTPNYAKGKLTKVTSSISETQYNSFDNFGRLLQIEQRTPFDTETVATATPRVSSYQYDFGGRLVAETYPSGRVVKNEFNSNGDLSRVASKSNATATERLYANSFSFTASGGIEKMRLGNGKFETAKFNNRLQITELGLGHSAADASLWKVNYEYGELENGSININKNTGNIARQTLSFVGLTSPIVQSYKYDSLDRLTEAKETSGTSANAPQNWIQTWDYDRFGNRIAFSQNVNGQQLAINSATLPSVNANSNRFNLGQGFAYDKNGNIVSDAVNNGRSFEFDAENKQTKVFNSSGGEVGKYYYDGEGKRVKKVAGNETTIFVYSSGKLIAEYSTQTATTPTISYTTSDHLGSPRVITDASGKVKSRRDFLPFGEEIGVNTQQTPNRASIPQYGASDNVRQKFTGYQKDNETNLDFAEARYYNNQHGRFTAVDPLLASGKSSNPQTFNRYVYVGNNPLTRIDPTGTDWVVNIVKRDGVEHRVPIYVKKAAAEREKAPNIWEITNRKGKTVGYQALSPYTDTASDVFKTKKEAMAAYEKLAVEDFDRRDTSEEMPFMAQSNGDIKPYKEIIEGGVQEAITPVDVALFLTPVKGLGGLFSSGAARTSEVLAESAAERAATSIAEGVGTSMEGKAFETGKLLQKHILGSDISTKLLNKGEAIHVFYGMETLSKVESTIFNSGTATGFSRNYFRFGSSFRNSIGVRIQSTTDLITFRPLRYGEMKVRENGLYHIIPRTLP